MSIRQALLLKYGFTKKVKHRSNLVKGATKLYFMYCFCVVIIFFITDLCKSAFSTYNFIHVSFSSFCVLAFRVYVSLGFNF